MKGAARPREQPSGHPRVLLCVGGLAWARAQGLGWCYCVLMPGVDLSHFFLFFILISFSIFSHIHLKLISPENVV